MESRNPTIVRILEEKGDVIENRHSGIPTMKREMKKGVTQRVADFCRNAESTSQFRRFMRSNLCLVLCDPKISLRVKAKVLLASIGV